MKKILLILFWGSIFGNVSDIDGNIYATIQIGEQLWMAENLNVSHYQNGDEILTGYNDADWAWTLETGAYSVYGNSSSNSEIYGNLYNWFTISDEREVCPTGWHIPSKEEYIELINFLGGYDIAGGKLKESGEELWDSPNIGATNESGFSAIPGGLRGGYGSGQYLYLGFSGSFWTRTLNNSGDEAYNLKLNHNSSNVWITDNLKRFGFSIRCIEGEIDWGCMNPNACNYDETAEMDNDSCLINDCAGECGGVEELDCNGICGGLSIFDECGECDGNNISCIGCTDSNAINYNPEATIDFGCEYQSSGDINGDGMINVVDIVQIVGIILNDHDFNILADVNIDGLINVMDIVILVNLILNNE